MADRQIGNGRGLPIPGLQADSVIAWKYATAKNVGDVEGLGDIALALHLAHALAHVRRMLWALS